MADRGELRRNGRALLPLAQRAYIEGQRLEARTLVDAALACATAAEAVDVTAECLELSARVASAVGDRVRSEAEFERAARNYDAVGASLSAARVSASAAFQVYDRGDAAGALARIEALEERMDEAGMMPLDPSVNELRTRLFGYRGNLARQARRYAEASALYERAIAASGRETGLRWQVTFLMDLGAAQLADLQPGAALVTLARASASIGHVLLDTDTRPLLEPLIEHYRVIALLSQGVATSSRELERGHDELRELRVFLWDATSGGTHPPQLDGGLRSRLDALAETSQRTEHARLGVRILRSLLAPEHGPRRPVTIARDGTTFACGSGVIDLSSRAALSKILAALVALGERAPGRALSLAELVHTGWPDQLIAPASARNRAHVALSTLRSFGLEGVLVRTTNGYRLEPGTWSAVG